MEITEIPFNKYIKIQSSGDKNSLELLFSNNMQNHLGTFHASGLFALAEACSGLTLKNCFYDMKDSAVPVLRRSEVKFKKPASSNIRAKGALEEEAVQKFRQQVEKRGRASVTVAVEVTDEKDTISMTGLFEWFVQKV